MTERVCPDCHYIGPRVLCACNTTAARHASVAHELVLTGKYVAAAGHLASAIDIHARQAEIANREIHERLG